MDFNNLYVVEIFVPTERVCSQVFGYSKYVLCLKTDNLCFQDIKTGKIYNKYKKITSDSILNFTPLSKYYNIKGEKIEEYQSNRVDELINEYNIFTRKNKIGFLLTEKWKLITKKEQTKVKKN